MNKLTVLLSTALLTAGFLTSNVEAEAAKKLYGYASNTPQKKAQQVAQMNEAVRKYATGKYKESAEKLEFIDSHGGCCDNVHYYLGLDYQNLGQTVLAQMHYQWVSSYSKSARLRQYADYASGQLAYYQAHRSYSGQGAVSPAMSFG